MRSTAEEASPDSQDDKGWVSSIAEVHVASFDCSDDKGWVRATVDAASSEWKRDIGWVMAKRNMQNQVLFFFMHVIAINHIIVLQ